MSLVNRNSQVETSPLGRSEGSITGGKGYGLFKGKTTSTGSYEPTVIALIALIILEFAAFAALRYTFRSVHGG